MSGRILSLQRQARELGRLRSGYTDTSGPKPRPVKSTTWIVTSHSEDYVRAAAALWGGEPEKWQPLGAGAAQWRVTTECSAIDAIMPPGDPLSQHLELWSKGGCARRCDGVTELLSDTACLCRAQFGDDFHTQPKERRCQATTRLSLILPAMPDIGVWRVETHGYYAANEIAATVDVIRGAVGDRAMVPVQARIEPRTRVSEGKTKQFPVIVLALRGVTAGQILSGSVSAAELSTAEPRSALPAGPTPAPVAAGPAQSFADRALDARSIETLQTVWREAAAATALAEQVHAPGGPTVLGDLLRRIAELMTPKPAADPPGTPAESTDALWMQVLAAAPEGWTTSDVIGDFAARHGGLAPGSATPDQLRAYLEMLPSLVDDGDASPDADEKIPF